MATSIWKYLQTIPDKRASLAMIKVFQRLFTDTGSAVGITVDTLSLGGGALTPTYLEFNKLSGATFTTAEANTLADVPVAVTGAVVSTATSAATQFVFLNAAGTTAIAHRFAGRAHISTTASGSTFGTVSGMTAVTNGAIGEITSGSFDFITTVSGRLGVNIVNGSSTNYITFTMPDGKLAIGPAITTS